MSTGPHTLQAARVGARQLALLRVVGVATLCGVAWGLIVSPTARQAEIHARAIEQTQQQIAAGAQAAADSPDPIAELSRLSTAARELKEFGAQPNDAQTLYNSYRQLADACGIRVDRVEPRTLDSTTGNSTVHSVVYTVDIAGTYEGVSKMIHAIQTQMGPTRVRAFRMTPASKPGADASIPHDWLVATIETVHVALVLPDAMKAAAKEASLAAKAQGDVP